MGEMQRRLHSVSGALDTHMDCGREARPVGDCLLRRYHVLQQDDRKNFLLAFMSSSNIAQLPWMREDMSCHLMACQASDMLMQ
jgi:hypothetical protein